MKIFLTAILSLIIASSIHAQDRYDPVIIASNNIKEIEGYFFEDENHLDSFLLSREYFNPKGRRTKVVIYDSIGVKSEYIYNHEYDTLLLERITMLQGKLHSKTKIEYDDQGREIKAVDYDSKDKKTGTYSITKYKDRKRIKEIKIFFSEELMVHIKEQFDENGTLVRYSKKENGKWVDRLNDGINPNISTVEIENADGLGLKLERRTQVFLEESTILGLKGKLNLSPRDILVNERYIDSNGLVRFEKQYLNHKLIGTKKYNYVS